LDIYMTSKPTPKLMLSQSFGEIELMAKAIGWEADFRQIEPGPLTLTVNLFGHADIAVMRIEFNRSFHQIASPPAGFVTFGLPDVDSGVLRC
jgi:hypothetical protein